MFKAVSSPFLVPYDGSFQLKNSPTIPPKEAPNKKICKKQKKIDKGYRLR